MSDKLTRKLVNVDPSEGVQLMSLKIEDGRTNDLSDGNAFAIDYLSTH
jgi:hypothetical protein